MRPCVFSAILLFGSALFAQSSQYVSSVDRSLTFDEIGILNFDDNSGGAYSKPLEEATLKFFEGDRRYHAEISHLPSPPLATLEENPKDLSADAEGHPRRAYLKTQVVKGPKGIKLRTVLFTGIPSQPLIVLEKNQEKIFDLESILQVQKTELTHLLEALPYQARILSRRANKVTINAGSLHGLAVGQDVLVVQVIQIERHPVLKFATQFEREIMGKVRLTQVDESLSFGDVIFEKTPSLVAPDFKVTFHESVTYESSAGASNQKGQFNGHVPNVGEVQTLAGIGKMSAQNRLVSSGSVSGEDDFTPTVQVQGELWLTQNWFSQISLQQFIGQINDNLPGSSPSSLNAQVLRANFVAGYHFLMQNDFFGPQLTAGLGYSKTRFSISDSSPTAITSLDYSSFALVAGGKFPIDLESGTRFYLGADFSYHLAVGLSESPASSGASYNSKIATVDFFANYPLRDNISLTTQLQFDQFNTNFSGVGARSESATSASLNFFSILGGVIFQF